MPNYDYKCSACGHTLEVFHKMSETYSKECPECGDKTLEKQLGAPPAHFRAMGFYETDFKRK